MTAATKSLKIFGTACLFAAATGAAAKAHPHVFAEARLEVSINNGEIGELRHVWRFDELFSSTVLLEFDMNANLKFERDELEAVGKVVHASLADFDYYTSIISDGRDIGIAAPDAIHVDFRDGQLLMFFAVTPDRPVPMNGKMSFGVYDPTMYTAIDFLNDTDLVVDGSMGACQRAVIRPDPDEILAQNQESLTEAFFNDPEGNDFSKFFATRLELTC